MKLRHLLLFTDRLPSNATAIVSGFILNTFKILLNWNKELRVNSILINDKLFIKNGFIIINWDTDNFLYAIINDKIKTTNRTGLAFFHFDKINQPIKVQIFGLFGKHEDYFAVQSTGEIKSIDKLAPTINSVKALPTLAKLGINISPIRFSFRVKNKDFSIKISPKETRIKPILLRFDTFQLDLSEPTISQKYE